MTEQAERVQRTPGTWLPIETAPKDGSVIDLWVVDAEYPLRKNDHRVSNASWSEDREDWEDGNLMTLLDECGFRPTHWMPLPEPPEEARSQLDAESL